MAENLVKQYTKYFYKLLNVEKKQNNGQIGGLSDTTLIISNISDETKTFTLSGEDIINMELKLNLSPYGKKWSAVGKYLHSFYVSMGQGDQISSKLLVENDQWDYLNELKNHLNTSSYPVNVSVQGGGGGYYSNYNLNITDGSQSLVLQGTQISDLLSKLNLTIYAAKWPNIVATLYNAKNGVATNNLLITNEQLNVLKNLYIRSSASVANEFVVNSYGLVDSSDYSSPDVWDMPVQYKNKSVIISDGYNVLTLKNNEIYKVYKKIKSTKYSKKLEYIRKKLHNITNYSSETIFVKPKELKFISILKNKSNDYIEKKYGKNKK